MQYSNVESFVSKEEEEEEGEDQCIEFIEYQI